MHTCTSACVRTHMHILSLSDKINVFFFKEKKERKGKEEGKSALTHPAEPSEGRPLARVTE